MKELTNFHESLVDLFGYMVQVAVAIAVWREKLNKVLSKGATSPQNSMYFGQGDPNDPSAKYQYRRTFGYLVKASEKDGVNFVIHHRSVLVLAVALWEDHFRERIAEECNIEKNDLQSDVFRDLNSYRQAILHGNNKLRKKPKVIQLFRKGDEISLTNEHMETIFRTLIDELNSIGTKYYGTNPNFNFGKKLYNQ